MSDEVIQTRVCENRLNIEQLGKIIDPLAKMVGVSVNHILHISMDPYGVVIRYWDGEYNEFGEVFKDQISEVMIKMEPNE